MDVKDNEYIRTIQGTIARIEDTEFDICFNGIGEVMYKHWVEDFGGSHVIYEKITTHSFNKIDLVEVGDYINGYRILEIHEALATDDERILDIGYGMAIFNENVETIVTKELIKANEYRFN